MKRIITTIIATATLLTLLSCFSGCGSRGDENNVSEQSNEENQIPNSTITKYTYTDSTGIVYPIYISSDGKAFIIKENEMTGDEYRRYLPKVTEEIKKEESIKKTYQ